LVFYSTKSFLFSKERKNHTNTNEKHDRPSLNPFYFSENIFASCWYWCNPTQMCAKQPPSREGYTFHTSSVFRLVEEGAE